MSQALEILQEINALEEVIANEQFSFERKGSALKLIRDRELYKVNYRSYDVYTHDRWDMKRRYADYLINAAEVMLTLRENNCARLPACESQVRPLTSLTQNQQIQAWNKILDETPNEKKITANLVKKIVKDLKDQVKSQQVPVILLSQEEKRILKAIECLQQSQPGVLREFIFSDRGSVLNLPIKASNVLHSLQLIELDYGLEVN